MKIIKVTNNVGDAITNPLFRKWLDALKIMRGTIDYRKLDMFNADELDQLEFFAAVLENYARVLSKEIPLAKKRIER